METPAHQYLKLMAMTFLRQQGCQAVATEVRCPISRYRVDAAGYQDSLPWDERQRLMKAKIEPRTIVIECKQSREDFLRDSEQSAPLLELREQMERIRCSIEEHQIKRLEPQLRHDGHTLFAELDDWDFPSSRLKGYREVLRKLRRIDEKLHGETKFFLVARYRLADHLYLAAPAGMIRRREVPPGWGLLVCPAKSLGTDIADEMLEVEIEAPRQSSKPTYRSRLLRNIAVAASWAADRHERRAESSTELANYSGVQM